MQFGDEKPAPWSGVRFLGRTDLFDLGVTADKLWSNFLKKSKMIFSVEKALLSSDGTLALFS